MISRDELIEALKSGSVLVNFTKTNGTERKMNCTLKQFELPAITDKITTTSKKLTNSNIVSAWDLDKQAWRSFRLDSVNSYNPIEDSAM